MTSDFPKRIFDIIVSIFLIILTLPIQIIILIITFIALKKNPIFIQERGITLDRFRFNMIKFRTMNDYDNSKHKRIINKNNFLITEHHSSINSFSKFCRTTGLDELPQLYNVLLGKMSLVGPRPLMIEELNFMKNEFPDYYKKRNLIKSKPGITGVWQIFGDRNGGAQNLVELDLFYENNKSILMDVGLLYYTFVLITHAKNSDSIKSRLNLFEKFFSTSFYPDNKNKSSGYIAVESNKGVKKYKINLPIEW